MNKMQTKYKYYSRLVTDLLGEETLINYDMQTFDDRYIYWAPISELELINQKQYIDANFVDELENPASIVSLLKQNIEIIYLKDCKSSFIWKDKDIGYIVGSIIFIENDNNDILDSIKMFLDTTIQEIYPKWIIKYFKRYIFRKKIRIFEAYIKNINNF